MRWVYILAISLLFSCTKGVRNTISAENKIHHDDICFTRMDFGDCFKSICIDSSGFYYLYCDSLINDKPHVIRVELSKEIYAKEFEFLSTIDTAILALDEEDIKKPCSLTKDLIVCDVKIKDSIYRYDLLYVIGCDTNSTLYKLEQVRHCFEKLKKDYPTDL